MDKIFLTHLRFLPSLVCQKWNDSCIQVLSPKTRACLWSATPNIESQIPWCTHHRFQNANRRLGLLCGNDSGKIVNCGDIFKFVTFWDWSSFVCAVLKYIFMTFHVIKSTSHRKLLNFGNQYFHNQIFILNINYSMRYFLWRCHATQFTWFWIQQ